LKIPNIFRLLAFIFIFAFAKNAFAVPTPIQQLVIPGSSGGTEEVQPGATLTIDSGAVVNGTFFGTGVATALGLPINSAGAFLVSPTGTSGPAGALTLTTSPGWTGVSEARFVNNLFQGNTFAVQNNNLTGDSAITFWGPSGGSNPFEVMAIGYQDTPGKRFIEMSHPTSTPVNFEIDGVGVFGTSFTATTNGTTSLTSISVASGATVTAGMGVTNPNLPFGTTLATYNAGAHTGTLSNAYPSSASGVAFGTITSFAPFNIDGPTGQCTLSLVPTSQTFATTVSIPSVIVNSNRNDSGSEMELRNSVSSNASCTLTFTEPNIFTDKCMTIGHYGPGVGAGLANNDAIQYDGKGSSLFILRDSNNGNIPFQAVAGGARVLLTGATDDGSSAVNVNGALKANSFVTDPSKINLTGMSVVVEGDSISAGVTATHPFSFYLASLPFFASSASIFNVATSGCMIPAGSNGGNNISDHYVANVKPRRPSANGGSGGPKAYLILMIGTNDLGTGGFTGSQVITNLTTYINTALADGFTVVLGTITPRSITGWTSTMEGYREQVNAAIINGIVPSSLVWDAASKLGDPTDTTYYSDALHWTTQSHIMIASYLDNGFRANGFFPAPNRGKIDVPMTMPSPMMMLGPLGQKTLYASETTTDPVPTLASILTNAGGLFLDAATGQSLNIGLLNDRTEAVNIGGTITMTPASGSIFYNSSTANQVLTFLSSSTGGTDLKKWANGGNTNSGSDLVFYAVNDAMSSFNPWLDVHRTTGTTIATVSFPNGNMTIGNLVYGTSSAPAHADGTNATATVTGTNMNGTLQVVVAGGATSGVITTLTLSGSDAFPTKTIMTLTPGNAATANLPIADVPFVTGTTTTAVLNTSGTGMPVGTYLWNYHLGGY
jgi:lysophospholipase L1-like esterase